MKKLLLLLTLCLFSVICFGKQIEKTTRTVVKEPIAGEMKPFKLFEEKAYSDLEVYSLYFVEELNDFRNFGEKVYIKGRLEAENIKPDSRVWVQIFHLHKFPHNCQKDQNKTKNE